MKSFKFKYFAGGTTGRVPDSAQLYTLLLINKRFQSRASTGGKESRDRTRKIKFETSPNLQPAQALVALLVFVSIATIVTAGATTITIINSQNTTKFSLGEEALYIAQSGADNAILRIIRNPSYTGETLTVGDGTATITVSGASTKTIVSQGKVGSFIRKIEVVGDYANNIFTITSTRQID